MESLWNSLDVVITIRTIAQWIVALGAIMALIFSTRAATLQKRQDNESATKNREEQIGLEHKLKSADSTQGLLSDSLVDAKRQIAEANKKITDIVTPLPLPERLRRLLNKIDPRILQALAQDKILFEVEIPSAQFNEFQEIAGEPNGHLYVTIDSVTSIGFSMEGMNHTVCFKLSPQLLSD